MLVCKRLRLCNSRTLLASRDGLTVKDSIASCTILQNGALPMVHRVQVGANARQLAHHKDSIGANFLGLQTVRVVMQRHNVQRVEPRAATSLPHTREIRSQSHSAPISTPFQRMAVVSGLIHGAIHALLTPWASSARRTRMAPILRVAFGL